MSRRHLASLGLALSLLAPSTSAEVRAVHHPNRGWSVEIEPDSHGRVWAPIVAHSFDAHVLNPGGDSNGDGRPAIGVRPLLGQPEVVWPMSSPQGFDLVLAQHDASGWRTRVRITLDTSSDDTNPVLAYDDAGRSVLLWQKTHDVWAVLVAGLSVDGRLWGRQVTEPVGFRPLSMQADGHEFYFATINPHLGLLRFRLAAFPFPNGGPALPFPDDSLLVFLLEEVSTGPDLDEPFSASQDPLGSESKRQPATLAALTLEMHRSGETVWADWVTTDATVAWIAFRGRQTLDQGEEPFRNGQVDQARSRIRRHVEGL